MKKAIPTVLILILIGVLGVTFYKRYWTVYSYQDDPADLNAHYGVRDEEDLPVILQDELTDYHGKVLDGEVYLNIQDVHTLLSDRFYYSEEDGTLLYCLPDGRISAQEGAKEWTDQNGETVTEDYRICVQDGEDTYVALAFVKPYANFSYELFENPYRLRMYTEWGEQRTAEVTKDTKTRVSGGVKSEVVSDVPAGSRVIILNEMEKWSKVETEDAHIGYLENKCLGEPETTKQTPVTDYTEPEVQHTLFDGKINMGWHQVAGAEGNASLAQRLASTQALNIVAPTWLTVTDTEGTVDSRASKEYVDQAHAAGLQVWAVLDNFMSGEVQESFLKKDAARAAVIGSALQAAEQCGLDGINVDIESISAESGDDFREFIRELSIACRREGLILSVDNYVPHNFNDFYGLDEQAVFADYVVIMGYDEHYAGSQEPGSVASLGYVSYGIEEGLKDVPAERLINGIPFYTRIWKTGQDGVSSTAYGMQEAAQFIENHGMEIMWDEVSGQYYAEGKDEEYLYQCWMEEKESVQRKLEVMQSYNIAGVAEWALGLEDPAVWDEIAAYVSQ
ncbi:MAG: chitinase [Lachnospiraceae bacterium]|nr:chitinase [Lachnospiraceae bacterium]